MEKKIIVDADSCPFSEEIITIAQKYDTELIFVFSTSHISEYPLTIKTVLVDNQKEAADIAIANLVCSGDLVVTQDYGLASMVLARSGQILLTSGMIVTEENIEQLLYFRHQSAKNRKKRVRVKGPRKLTKEDRLFFIGQFEKILQRMLNVGG